MSRCDGGYDMRFETKVAVITGGASGIGAATARLMAREGARVVIGDLADASGEALVRELGPDRAAYLNCDVAQELDVNALIAEAMRRFGRIDVLFNNAGASWGAGFDEFPEAGWDKVMDINVKSVFFLTQKLAPLLEAAAGPGNLAKVINIGSIDGQHVSDLETYSYAASKAGVLHMTRMMAKFLAKRHISVNAIAPGFFPSKMTAGIAEEFREAFRAATPMQRWGTPDDMAGVALFLSSRASDFLCGSVVTVDGGYATTV